MGSKTPKTKFQTVPPKGVQGKKTPRRMGPVVGTPKVVWASRGGRYYFRPTSLETAIAVGDSHKQKNITNYKKTNHTTP